MLKANSNELTNLRLDCKYLFSLAEHGEPNCASIIIYNCERERAVIRALYVHVMQSGIPCSVGFIAALVFRQLPCKMLQRLIRRTEHRLSGGGKQTDAYDHIAIAVI